MPTRLLCILAALTPLSISCVDDVIDSEIEDALDDNATVADRACQAFVGENGEKITAAADTSGAIPAVTNGPKLYAVTLPGDSPPREGVLQFTPTSSADYLILVQGGVPYALQSASGSPITAAEGGVECSDGDVPDGYTYTFEAGTPYNLTFGPTSAGSADRPFKLVIALDPMVAEP